MKQKLYSICEFTLCLAATGAILTSTYLLWLDVENGKGCQCRCSCQSPVSGLIEPKKDETGRFEVPKLGVDGLGPL